MGALALWFRIVSSDRTHEEICEVASCDASGPVGRCSTPRLLDEPFGDAPVFEVNRLGFGAVLMLVASIVLTSPWPSRSGDTDGPG